jgi:hypothetical protein
VQQNQQTLAQLQALSRQQTQLQAQQQQLQQFRQKAGRGGKSQAYRPPPNGNPGIANLQQQQLQPQQLKRQKDAAQAALAAPVPPAVFNFNGQMLMENDSGQVVLPQSGVALTEIDLPEHEKQDILQLLELQSTKIAQYPTFLEVAEGKNLLRPEDKTIKLMVSIWWK